MDTIIKIIIIYTCYSISGLFLCWNFFNPALVIYIKPFIIPTFIIYVLNNNFNKLTLNYYLYVIFFYINELFFVWEDSVHLSRTALIASFFCYLALVNLGYNSIKTKTLHCTRVFTFLLAMVCVF
jgi:hypothetical protein